MEDAEALVGGEAEDSAAEIDEADSAVAEEEALAEEGEILIDQIAEPQEVHISQPQDLWETITLRVKLWIDG